MKDVNIKNVKYFGHYKNSNIKRTKSISVIGLDTEADNTGKCFMLCTSLGDIFTPKEMPQIFLTRRYRDKIYVVYNLKYDEGAILQNLPKKNLIQLREKNITIHKGFKYKIIPRKFLRISKGHMGVTFYDLANFFKKSLDQASKELLGEGKLEIETKTFTKGYINNNWNKIKEYCIKDAVLVKRLADILIGKFESFGVYPQKLYSTAYVSYQYFRQTCKYPVVKKFWDYNRELLSYAMQSYNGGKFEVTQKGPAFLYEYDINSAYPFEIRNLEDISDSKVYKYNKYIKEASYGFIDCIIEIPFNTYSPIAIKRGGINTFPVGVIRAIITKAEYDYLLKQGVNIDIQDAFWIYNKYKSYPFRKEINRLTKLKTALKDNTKSIDYHIIKILLNSLYGKFVQLIKKDNMYIASSCWNPIYGSIITANNRIRVTECQQMFDSVKAVHTDSLLSTKPLPYKDKALLGEFGFEVKGDGVILGSGIYQIGDKSKFRGFDSRISIIDMLSKKEHTLKIKIKRPLTWREVIFHGWEVKNINRFVDIEKELRVDFDQKRIWLDDYKNFGQCLKRNVESIPLYFSDLLY